MLRGLVPTETANNGQLRDCAWCRGLFLSRRVDAATCSDRCRAAYRKYQVSVQLLTTVMVRQRCSRSCAAPRCRRLLPLNASARQRFCSSTCRVRANRVRPLDAESIQLRRCALASCASVLPAGSDRRMRYCSGACKQEAYRRRVTRAGATSLFAEGGQSW